MYVKGKNYRSNHCKFIENSARKMNCQRFESNPFNYPVLVTVSKLELSDEPINKITSDVRNELSIQRQFNFLTMIKQLSINETILSFRTIP